MNGIPEHTSSVKKVTSKLRECEDFNLALKLQEEEFNSHYDRNRNERRVMGVDTKKSKEEHEKEKKEMLEKRMREFNEISRRDEELAKRIQMEIEAEERRKAEEQARHDLEVARRLQDSGRYSDEVFSTPLPYEEDERLARELQERYLRRVSGSRGMMDERTQNELMYYVGRQVLSPPENLLPRSRDPSQLGPPPGIPATHFSTIAAVPPTTTVIDSGMLPPLPSYTEVCSPMTPVVTTVNSGFGNCGTTTGTISPASASILTDTGNAAIPARAPLHPIVVRDESGNLVNGNQIDSPLPEPPTELTNSLTNNNTEIKIENFHPTNPFLQDLLINEYNANNPGSEITAGSSSNRLESEFGLPPPSDLFYATENIASERQSTSGNGRNPQGGVPLVLGVDRNELLSKLPKQQN